MKDNIVMDKLISTHFYKKFYLIFFDLSLFVGINIPF